MVRIGAWPGPTAELCTPVVVEGLHDLRPGVHDERSMLSDRLTDRAPLEQHELDAGVACNQSKVLAGHHGGASASADRFTIPDLHCRTSKGVENTEGLLTGGAGHDPSAAGADLDVPDGEIGLGFAAHGGGGGAERHRAARR